MLVIVPGGIEVVSVTVPPCMDAVFVTVIVTPACVTVAPASVVVAVTVSRCVDVTVVGTVVVYVTVLPLELVVTTTVEEPDVVLLATLKTAPYTLGFSVGVPIVLLR